MKKNYSKVLSVLNLAGKVKEPKRFHKIYHILRFLGFEAHEEFQNSYFGPYSPDLQLEIEFLENGGFIKEENGAIFCIQVSIDAKAENLNVGDFKSVIEDLNNKDYLILEILSTMLYLLEKGYSEQVLEKKMKILKPQRVQEIQFAKKEIKEIMKMKKNLAKTRRSPQPDRADGTPGLVTGLACASPAPKTPRSTR